MDSVEVEVEEKEKTRVALNVLRSTRRIGIKKYPKNGQRWVKPLWLLQMHTYTQCI